MRACTQEIAEREAFRYPPFTRLIKIIVKHTEDATADKAAKDLGAKLVEKLSAARVLGPERPLVERVRNQFIYEIMIKLEKNLPLKAVKNYISEQIEAISVGKEYKGCSIIIDVDCG
jgi:primosomal protein N' (replication factor Y)